MQNLKKSIVAQILQQASVCQTSSEDMGQTSHGSRSSLFSIIFCLFVSLIFLNPFQQFERNNALFKDLQQASVCQTASEDMGQTSHDSTLYLCRCRCVFVYLIFGSPIALPKGKQQPSVCQDMGQTSQAAISYLFWCSLCLCICVFDIC